MKAATGLSASQFFKTRIGDKIGANGLFVILNFNKVFFSRSRDMARFRLLVLANGNWEGTEVYASDAYFDAMSQSSQELNPASNSLEHERELAIYPNPTSGELTIRGSAILQISLFDIHGNEIQRKMNQKIDLDDYSPGIYLLKIEGRDGIVQWEKIVLQ